MTTALARCLACVLLCCLAHTCRASAHPTVGGHVGPRLPRGDDDPALGADPALGDAVAVDGNSDDDADDDDDERDAVDADEGTSGSDDGGPTTVDADEAAARAIVARVSGWMRERRRAAPDRDRPFVTLAYAQTLDGMLAARDATSRDARPSSNLRLSGPASSALTHRLRALHDGVLVGGGTFLADAPRLSARPPPAAASSMGGASVGANVGMEQPVPIVLDTHLRHLQRLLFGRVVATAGPPKKGALPDDIAIDRVRARRPVVCCSAAAARSFLDALELFQGQQSASKMRKRKRSYEITVIKRIDAEEDHARDHYLPIKISIRVIQHHKHSEDEVQEVDLTLLPCPVRGTHASLEVRQVLRCLRRRCGVESVMVEGGAGVLSSFLGRCVEGGAAGAEEDRRAPAVDCLCATIAPSVMGGRWGLPAFGGLDALPEDDGDDGDGDGPASTVGDGETSGGEASDHEAPGEDASARRGDRRPPLLPLAEGRFASLGPDCVFLGRVRGAAHEERPRLPGRAAATRSLRDEAARDRTADGAR